MYYATSIPIMGEGVTSNGGKFCTCEHLHCRIAASTVMPCSTAPPDRWACSAPRSVLETTSAGGRCPQTENRFKGRFQSSQTPLRCSLDLFCSYLRWWPLGNPMSPALQSLSSHVVIFTFVFPILISALGPALNPLVKLSSGPSVLIQV